MSFQDCGRLDNSEYLEDPVLSNEMTEDQESGSFDKVEYWSKFYKSDGDELEFYEWYSAEWLPEFVSTEVDKVDGDSVLDIGCGTSPLLFTLANGSSDTSERIQELKLVGVDFVEEAIEFLKKEAIAQSVDIDFRVMDVTQGLQGIRSSSFSVVVDKGCLDCFVTGEGTSKLAGYLKEVARVLKGNGSFLLLPVNFANIRHLLQTGEIVADTDADGVRSSSAAALEARKRADSATTDVQGTSRHGLEVHHIVLYQQKHLYICKLGPCEKLSVTCGGCGLNMEASYPKLDKQCVCGNALRRFALS
ncbi:hypothetical protein NDN08_003666 [Rhodosorus marinus]|uniref:Methyltransferase domain-containing protein n=1 Tax=Rhodosorus marinus TaxID=101924 RepID=A0AAV8UXG3_9RHOD|nr:hypothetical protein NDN08_003666 [Rhodosorus marinus]